MENNKLYTLKCSACSGNTPKLNLDQIVKNLNNPPLAFSKNKVILI